jgi:hypothetical protein
MVISAQKIETTLSNSLKTRPIAAIKKSAVTQLTHLAPRLRAFPSSQQARPS